MYALHQTKDPTCTEEGVKEYKCTVCKSKHTETIPAMGHKPGEPPTLDVSQVCDVCGMVLAGPVNYMSYRGNDLALNQYFGYSHDYVTTPIVSQTVDRFTPDPIPFMDKNDAACYVNLSIPVQDFFKHNVNSVMPLTTLDGKTYTTDSGFNVAFTFDLADKAVDSIHAWDKGASKEFRGADPELLKIVGEYRANPSYYNTIYELVDFSECYIEVALKTENGYETIKEIREKEDWKAVLQSGSVDISDDNGAHFYASGTYRIMFKYNMTWITDPPSAVYALDDVGKSNPIYPYGRLNDQYEYFYVTVTDERNNVLVPSDVDLSDSGFFCQLRAATDEVNHPFIAAYSMLEYNGGVAFAVGAKLDMSKTAYYYNNSLLQDFSLLISVYNAATDTYDAYKTYDLIEKISRDLVYGKEIILDIGHDTALRDKKCKITTSYSFLDGKTGETITEQQNYYYTLHW